MAQDHESCRPGELPSPPSSGPDFPANATDEDIVKALTEWFPKETSKSSSDGSNIPGDSNRTNPSQRENQASRPCTFVEDLVQGPEKPIRPLDLPARHHETVPT